MHHAVMLTLGVAAMLATAAASTGVTLYTNCDASSTTCTSCSAGATHAFASGTTTDCDSSPSPNSVSYECVAASGLCFRYEFWTDASCAATLSSVAAIPCNVCNKLTASTGLKYDCTEGGSTVTPQVSSCD